MNSELASIVIQLFGVLCTAAVGGMFGRKYVPLVGTVMGLIINVVGQILVAGGGPGACVGFVFLPLVCIVAGYLGYAIRYLIAGPVDPQPFAPEDDEPHCNKCGYSLRGLVSRACPECGTSIDDDWPQCSE